MTANRLIILLAIIVTLTFLLLQNWSPVLPLTFLGMRTKPLPLAIWIILSILTGAVTSWLISNLYQLSRYFTTSKQPTPNRNTSRRPSVQESTREEVNFNTKKATTTPKKPEPTTPIMEDDDWDTDGANDDWDFEESSTKQRVQDSRDYERPSESNRGDKRGDKYDSAYSYSYREPKNTGVGKTESVYDADYRVIIPPYQPPEKSSPVDEDEDDWGFFEEEEEDFDDDAHSPPKRDR